MSTVYGPREVDWGLLFCSRSKTSSNLAFITTKFGRHFSIISDLETKSKKMNSIREVGTSPKKVEEEGIAKWHANV